MTWRVGVGEVPTGRQRGLLELLGEVADPGSGVSARVLAGAVSVGEFRHGYRVSQDPGRVLAVLRACERQGWVERVGVGERSAVVWGLSEQGYAAVGVAPPAAVGSDDGRAEREWVVGQALHSVEMEGLVVDEGTRADAGEFVQGRIGSDELVSRTRARYGVS